MLNAVKWYLKWSLLSGAPPGAPENNPRPASGFHLFQGWNFPRVTDMLSFTSQHCAKGKTVYAPQIVFLQCGGSSALPKGVWYHYSYGTIAMYKQDWDNFGGFSKEILGKKTWGGEDWDIIDGAVKGGLEIERKRSPWIYHYYHTKAGMWRQATWTLQSLCTKQ